MPPNPIQAMDGSIPCPNLWDRDTNRWFHREL